VIANIERAKSLAGTGTAAALAVVKAVEKIDSFTVALKLTRPSASLLLQLSDKTGAMISPPALRGGNLANATAGAGMYRLESFRQGDKGVYIPYEKYWDKDAVKLKRFEMFDFANPSAAINALLSGQVDAATIAPGDMRAAANAGFDIVKNQTLETWFIAFDHRKGDLRNPLVRRAMAHAIDKKAIISALFHGEAVETVQTFPKGYWAYAPKAVPENFAFNLDKARQLMKESGSKGFDLPLLHAPSDFYRPLVEALQAQLGALDIRVTSDPRDGAAVAQAWLGGNGTGLLGPWSGRPDPYITDFLLYSKNSTFANVSKLEDPRIEKALAESELAGDFAKRAKLLQDVSQYASETQFHLSLWNPNQIIAMKKNVKNLKIWVTSKPEFRGVHLT
jgi:peptide/nickel transport system substrate-binding protein